MNASILAGLSAIVLLGALAQWIGWRLHLPAILLLLLFGFAAGPEGLGLVDPDAIFGDLLLPLVSLSVAVLLFEGALTLKIRELGVHGAVVARLVTLGAGVTWLLSALGAHYLLGLEVRLAVLLGAILTVTGPTVVLPILRQVRPMGSAGSILKWEGILIDPVGAVLAVLVFEYIVTESGIVSGILKTIVFGGAVGALGAWLLVEVLRRYWVPDHLHSPTALAFTVLAYAAANAFQHEAGLLSVTFMGVLLANQSKVSVRHILEFKENLRVLIISALFIVLAARMRATDLAALDVGAVVFILLLVLVIRPVSVWACTLGSKLPRKDRIYIASLAPRGVVAAAVTAVFALRLEQVGIAGARGLVADVFLVIFFSVAIYGLGAGPLAFRLGLATPKPQGVLFVGAHRLARALARVLQEGGFAVRLIDTNARAIAKARMEGLPVYFGNVLADEEWTLPGIGKLLAMTPNDEVNSLSAIHYLHLFGRQQVYQLEPRKGTEKLSQTLRGRILFGEGLTYDELVQRLDAGSEIKATPLTEQFGFEQWRAKYGEQAVPLLTLGENGNASIATTDRPLDPQPGQTLVAIV